MKTVELVINGTSKGQVDTKGKDVGTFVNDSASTYGLRTFNVYVDGEKKGKKACQDSLESSNKVELIAKDARG